ncbi:MAG: metalloregulator ArsR/SmtB family transcription factor [Caldilineaceae bacterium]
MFSLPFQPLQQQPVTVKIAIEPIYNALMSLAALTERTDDYAVEPWITATAARLSPSQQRNNRLVFAGLGEVLLPAGDHATFSAYLDALAALPPLTLRARIKTEPNPALDAELQQEVARLLANPPAMQELIVNHLRTLWDSMLAAEWQQSLRNLHSMHYLLRQRTWPTASAGDALRAFLRGELPDTIGLQLQGVSEIIFVPSPHLHLRVSRFGSATTLWVFALANFWSLPLRTEPIQRGEVLGPINALADDTRLRILELLAASEELRAQEIIAQLDVSQPTVSRHLKQLLNAGFITEQRAGDANKIYQLQPKRVNELAYNLAQLLSPENAHLILTDVRLTQPAELRPFLDREGLVTTWPAKRKGQQAVLDYLITKFAPEERYTEAQVNDLLKQWHTYNDPAYLRRSLVDGGLLKRTPDGAQYWRE